jgi:AcrR family transcriptional regulator
MENKHEPVSEEKILEAARRVFQRSGYSGARMQEIADEAGINKAMLHYYYRSKDNLFESVFSESLQKLVGKVGEMLDSDKPF